MKLFEEYKGAFFDEMLTEKGAIREYWQPLAESLQELDIKGLAQKQEEIDWQLKENGVSYNIYSDVSDSKRKWNLDPIPFILPEDQFEVLTQGLKQRAKLLDRIFKDIYGEQQLLKKGILPAEILYLDSHFIREVYGFENAHYDLAFYAADLSRGPDGKFWVISDKTEVPSGLGYAIENRLTMQNINLSSIHNIHVHNIIGFIEGFKASFDHYTPGEKPFVVLLSPGPYNETYFEHSFLSSILECELVRGEDLLVKDSHLYLKNLSGLKKVDVVIRRVDDRFCDPLELRNDSQLGVAGLLEVLRQGNVKMINPIGVGVLENLGLNPFLNNICEYFFNEPLILPQIATWWCGQEKERKYVLKNLKELIIKSIDKRHTNNMVICEDLDEKALASLKLEIETNPYMYIAQEKINFSTIPSFSEHSITAKKNSIRLFCYKDSNEYHVMKGGLARISSDKDRLIVSNQRGAGSKDLWILSDEKEKDHNDTDLMHSYREISFASIITKRAENIYWLGRYLKRAIVTARVIRLSMKYLINHHAKDSTMRSFLNTLTHITMTYPGFLSTEDFEPIKELESLIKERTRAGTLSFTVSMLSNVHLNIRDQFSNEARKVFDKLESKWQYYAKRKSFGLRDSVDNLDELLIYLSAYKELIRESISKEEGLIFYQIGSKVEMAMLLISQVRSLLTHQYDRNIEQEVLQFILNAHESYTTYRGYYKSNLRLEFVVEFLILQKNYSKSLASLMKALNRQTQSLIEMDRMQMRFYSSSSYIQKILTLIDETKVKDLINECNGSYVYCELDNFLDEVASLLSEFSHEFTKNYFTHYYE